MAMIFIGGSRDIFELPEPVIARIGAMIAAEHGLLAGYGYDRRQRRRSWRPTVERDRVRRGNTSPIPSIRPILADTIQAAIAPYATMRPRCPGSRASRYGCAHVLRHRRHRHRGQRTRHSYRPGR